MVHIGNSWDMHLSEEFASDYYLSLREFLKAEYSHYRVYPEMGDIYNALRYTAPEDARVVILGQDPYHGAGQAHGLCFSVKPGIKKPPSLKNIWKELEQEYGIAEPEHGLLTGWAKQGVLLLNTTLTVREASPTSHVGHGWERLTDAIISKVNEVSPGCVFLLWGGNARSKAKLVTNPRHLVLQTVHPSPLSAYGGFFGCGHFRRANEYLDSIGRGEIDWSKNDG